MENYRFPTRELTANRCWTPSSLWCCSTGMTQQHEGRVAQQLHVAPPQRAGRMVVGVQAGWFNPALSCSRVRVLTPPKDTQWARVSYAF
jgi:hypothetical protein